MKKAKRIAALLVCLALVLAALGLVGCTKTDPNAVVGIEIATQPFTTEYKVGDTFDPTGLVVKAKTGGGAFITLSANDYTLSAPDMTAAGTKTVTVTYQSFTATFSVTVKAEAEFSHLDMMTGPTKQRYFVGEEISLAGMVLRAVYDDDSSVILGPDDYTVSPVDTSTTGTKTVTVTYGEESIDFTVEVSYGIFFNVFETAEKDFLYENYATDSWLDEGHRSADYRADKCDEKGIGAYFTYVFHAGSKLSEAVLHVTYRFRTTVAVSFDNVTYKPVLQAVAVDQTKFESDFDLKDMLTGSDVHFDDNEGLVYVRFYSTSQDGTGFGADIYNCGLYYALADPAKYVPLSGDPYAAMRKVTFDAASDGEETFLYHQKNTGIFDYTEEHAELSGLHSRFTTNKEGFFIYGVNVGSSMRDAVLQLHIINRTKIEVSFDGETYTEILAKTSTGNAMNANLSLSEKASEVFAANTGKLYVRFSSAVPEDDFGATMLRFKLNYTLTDDTAYVPATGIEYVNNTQTEGTLTFACIGDETERTYYNVHEGDYVFGASANPEENNPQFRTVHNGDGYFVYGFDFGAKLTATAVKVHLNQLYQTVKTSFDGNTFATVYEGNPSDKGEFFLELDIGTCNGFAANTGVLYLYFGGISGQDGFNICVLDISITYSLAGEHTAYPAVTGAADAVIGMPVTQGNLTFEAKGGALETKYLNAHKGDYVFGASGNPEENNPQYRTVNNGDGYFVYGFDFGAKLTELHLTALIEQMYQVIKVSFDGETFTEIRRANPSTDGRFNFTYDITQVEGFAENTGKLYLFFGGISGQDGFNICLTNVSLDYVLQGDYDEYPEVQGLETLIMPEAASEERKA